MEKTPKVSSPGSEEIEYAGTRTDNHERNIVYEEDEELGIQSQTYFALAAMFLLNLLQVFGLMDPSAAVKWSALNRDICLISLTTYSL